MPAGDHLVTLTIEPLLGSLAGGGGAVQVAVAVNGPQPEAPPPPANRIVAPGVANDR